MNYLQLAQRVWREVGYSGVGPVNVATQNVQERRVLQWVNQAYYDIQNKWSEWHWLWAEGTHVLVAGTSDYAKPTGLSTYQEDTFRIGSDAFLDYVRYDEYRRMPRETTQARPNSFTILPNKKIRYINTPNATYTVNFEYYLTGDQLVDSTDTPLIPDEYQDTIIWGAKILWAQYEEAAEQLQATAALYAAAMRRLESNQLPNVDNHNSRVMGVDIVVVPE